MKRTFIGAILIFMSLISSAVEVDFDKSGFEGAIPVDWKEATNLAVGRNISIQNPTSLDGRQSLTFNLYNGTENATRVLYCTNAVENVACDNVSAEISIYRKKGLSGKIDKIEVVVSTNNFETCEPVGQVDLQERFRETDGWVTNTVSEYIPGLSSEENKHNVKIGLRVVAAGASSKLGYVGWMKVDFVASATPKEVAFVRNGAGGGYPVLEDLLPGETNAMVSATVTGLPAGKILFTNVYATVTRNGRPSDEMQLFRVGDTEQYVSSPITNAFDAGEAVSISIRTEYAVVPPEPPDPPLPTLGKQEDGIAKEYANSTEKIVGKKGSVWINEIVEDGDELAIEFAGTTNRVMTSGWKIAISNETFGTAELEHPISGRLDFTDKVVNDVVGFDDRRFAADVIASGTNVVRLINSRDICECEVKVVKDGGRFAYGLAGIATWNDEYGYSYDWTGTGEDVSAGEGVFRWLTNAVVKATIGDVNYAQGFKVPFSTTITIRTATGSGADLPYAAVSVLAQDVTNVVESSETLFSAQTSSNGIAVISFSGHSCSNSSDRIPVKVSASAFGWTADEILYEVALASNVTNSFTVPMSRVPAFYDGDSLAAYWIQTNAIKWAVYTAGGRKSIRLNLYNAREGTNSIMQCANPFSSGGKKYVSVSLDFRNAADANMQKYNELCIALGTNSTLSGKVVDAVVLSNKRVEYAKDDWYSYSATVELPEGFDEAELWLNLVSRTIGGPSSAFLYVDNLRIAFQDIAMPTNLVRSIEHPASGESVEFDLDVIPQTTGTVSEVSVDLHLVLNGVTNVVPFAFMTNDTFTSEMFADDYTNAIPLVVEDGETKAAKLTISPAALEAALGKSLGLNRPFLVGDEVTYFAAVRYNSDNGATTPDELYETRYFPDNSTIDGEGRWVVEGDYGVNTNLEAYSFIVEGPALSKFGEVVPSAEGVKFNLHGFSTNDISDLSVNIKVKGSDVTLTNLYPFADLGLATNAQRRVTGTCELSSGLAANTEYTVTINALDADGKKLEEATFTFVTLPVVESATISPVATNAVELTVSGTAAGYVVPTGWVSRVSSGANTWLWSVPTPNANVTWESVPVYGTNKLGKASETVFATPTSLYTLAAPATKGPVVSNVVTTVTVQADQAHNDGNSEFTLYGLRITTSDVNDTERYATTNGVEVWKTLAAWKNDAPLELAEPIINLSATNYYSFIARNNDGTNALAGAAVTTNWFGMTTGFVGEGQQVTEPFGPGKLRGSVAFTLEAFDPAKSASATNVVQCEIGTNVWIHAYPVQFTDLTITNNFVWDAWKDVTDRFGEVPWLTNYTLRATVTDGKRASAEQEISGWLDFAPPANLAISGAPEEGTAVNTTSYDITFSATDTNALGYNWELTGTSGTTVTKGTGSSASITELVDGDYTLSVTATDIMGNASETNRHWTVDTTPPTVTRFETTTPSPFNAAKVPMVVTVEFSEPVTGFAADDVDVVNCTVSAVEGSGAAYTFEVRPAADGEVSVQIKANAVVDRAGNGNVASTTLTHTYDTVRPTVTRFETTTPEYFNAKAAPMLVTVAFSEPVAGFTTNEVTVANGVATNVVQDADAYVVAIAPLADGPIAVQIAENAVIDLAGNGNVASATLTRTYDNTIPQVLAVVGTPWNGCVTNLAAYRLSATASDAITDAGKLVFHWSVNDTPANTAGNTLAGTISADGPYTVSVYVTDEAGNDSAAASYSWTLDRQPPTGLEITGDPAAPGPDGRLVVTNGTGFAFEAINATDAYLPLMYRWTLNGSAVGETSSTFSGTTELEGTNTVSVWVIDAAGNESSAPASRTWVVDLTPPTEPQVSGVPTSPTDVPAFTLGASSTDATALTYHWTLNGSVAGDTSPTLSGTAVEGENTVSVFATDEAGNVSPTNTVRWKLDTKIPENLVFVVAPAEGAVTNTATFEIKVSADDLTTLTYHWALIGPSGTNATGRTIGETISATAVEGTNTVSVFAEDALGHRCEPTNRTWVVDTTAPTKPSVEAQPAELTNVEAFTITVASTDATALTYHWTLNGSEAGDESSTLSGTAVEGENTVVVYATDEAGNESERTTITWVLDTQPPTGLGIMGDPAAPGSDGRLVVTNGTGFAFAAINVIDKHFPLTYRWATNGVEAAATSAVFSANDAMEGTNTVSVWAIDAAGNESSAPASRTWVVDLTPPTEPQVSGVPENGLTNVEAFELTATAEDATALAYHWTLNGVAVDETSSTYSGTADEGTNTVSVFATDEAGNVSPTNTVRWVLDTHGPTVELSTETPGSPYVFNDYHVFKVRVEFNEPVVNFTTNSVTVHNGTVTNVVPVEGSDVAYEVMIRPLTDGDVIVQVENNKVTDLASNWNVASEPLTRTCDITHPKATITDAEGESGPIDAEITEWYVLVRFDEEVQNLSKDEVTVNTGNVVRVMPTANQNEYRVKITFDGDYDGPVTVQVDADKVSDLAGNRNDASDPLTRYHGNLSGDVEFGGGVCVKVDPVTGTNSVSFTAVDFRPGATSTFTLSGFAASTQGSEFQMWFVVCDTLGGATRHAPVEFKKFESGELTVTLPAAATTGRNTLFILGVDNKGE